MVAVEGVDAQTDIGKGIHAEIVLNECGVRLLLINGRALHEEAVALMLELGKNCLPIVLAELCDGAREADIHVIVSLQSPLSPQVASVAPFLTGGNEE